MSILAILAVVPSTGGLIGLLVWVAIACIVGWAIFALVKWSGIPIPQPVWILLSAFIGIALILVIARFFGYLT
jgi:hypothetical protein